MVVRTWPNVWNVLGRLLVLDAFRCLAGLGRRKVVWLPGDTLPKCLTFVVDEGL